MESVVVSVRMPVELHEQVKAKATELDRSANWVVVDTLRQAFASYIVVSEPIEDERIVQARARPSWRASGTKLDGLARSTVEPARDVEPRFKR